MDYINQFRNAMARNGLNSNAQLIPDGQLHRIHVDEDSPNTQNGWYILFGDGIPSGAYGCWKRGISETWCSKSKSEMTQQDWSNHLERITQAKEKQSQAKIEARDRASLTANRIWNESMPANDNHPYLLNKGVKSYNLRVSEKGSLIIPLYNNEDQLTSLQFIAPNGKKMFLRDGSLKGNYFLLSYVTDTLYLVEGYSTGATIHLATNCGVIVAFNAGNLLNVAENILKKYPEKRLILAGDDDKWPHAQGEIINVGRQKAEETAKVTKIKCVFPNFTGLNITEKPTDWNDLHKGAGLDEVKRQIEIKDSEAQDISLTRSEILVKQEQKNAKEQKNDLFPEIDPWHEEVDACALLNDIESLLNQILVFPSQHETKAISLWIIHTYCLDFANVSPILNISSPEKRCGKSTLLGLLQLLVHKPLIASNITAAAIFRSIDKWHPTLLIDEADTFMRDNEELRGVINSGHSRKLAYTLRCVGDKHEPTPFSTWSAKVIAGIGHLAETIEDRSIIIQLRRKLPHEKRKRIYDVSQSTFEQIVRKCIRFRNDNGVIIEAIRPKVPEVLNDRATDNWSPLLAIAELAGNEWIKYATEAAIHLSGDKEAPTSIGVELLQDIRNIFNTREVDRLYTQELLTALHSEEEAPWLTYNRGKPLSSRQLATRLKEYKIHSKDMRLPPFYKTLKGYSLEDFSEAFSCYIPADKNLAATSATTLQSPINASFDR